MRVDKNRYIFTREKKMKYEKKKVMIIYIIYTMIFGVKLIDTRHSIEMRSRLP